MTITDPLSEIVSLLGSSLSMYVADAGIWSYPGEEQVKLAIADLVDDQRSIIDRAGIALEDRGMDAPRRGYPIRFTATHDLDLRSLLPRIVAELRQQTGGLEEIIESGGHDPLAVDLAREARLSTTTHADAIENLLAR
jgi:hypothetical protein